MADWRTSVVTAIRDGWCAFLGNNANFYDWWNSNVSLAPEGDPTFARQMYRANCNREPPNNPPLQPSGGQCPAEYRVDVSVTYEEIATGNRFPPETFSSTCSGGGRLGLVGPVSFTGVTQENGFYAARINALNTTGDPAEFVVTQPANAALFQPVDESFDFTRCDNLPDDCGGGQTNPPPPGYNDVPRDVTYTDEDGNDVTIPIGIIYLSPTLNIDGTISVPVRVTIGDPTLNIDIDADFDFNLGDGSIKDIVGGSDGKDARKGCDPKEFESDEPIPEPPDGGGAVPPPPVDDPASERIIRAVVVTVTDPGNNTSQILEGVDAPIIYVPSAGVINFQIRVGNSDFAWLPDIPVKNSKCLIDCPWEGGAIAAYFTPRYGSAATVTLIYASREAAITDPGANP